MTDPSNTITQPGLIAKLLGRTDASTPSDEIRAALSELNQRRTAIEQRLKSIQRDNSTNGGHGPERARVLETGSPAELVELDNEVERLRAELNQQLPAQDRALRERLDQADKAEAAERLPARLKALPKALAEHDRALAALQAARAEVDATVSGIISDRKSTGPDAPGVDQTTAQRIAEIRGFGDEPARPDRYNYTRAAIFQDLGAGRTERRQPDYEPFGRKNRKSEKLSAEEQPDTHLASAGVRAGETQQSTDFWNKSEPGQPRRPLES